MNARYKVLLICGPRDRAWLFLSISPNFQLDPDTECKARPGSPWYVWRMPDDPRVYEKLGEQVFTLDFSFIAYRCVCCQTGALSGTACLFRKRTGMIPSSPTISPNPYSTGFEKTFLPSVLCVWNPDRESLWVLVGPDFTAFHLSSLKLTLRCGPWSLALTPHHMVFTSKPLSIRKQEEALRFLEYLWTRIPLPRGSKLKKEHFWNNLLLSLTGLNRVWATPLILEGWHSQESYWGTVETPCLWVVWGSGREVRCMHSWVVVCENWSWVVHGCHCSSMALASSRQCRQVSQEKGGLLRPSRRGGQQWPPVQDRALEDGNLEVALGKSGQ